jgi:hypothetical protein
VEIVESLRPLWGDGEGWTIDPNPFIDIGAPDGPPENQLYVVVGAARFPDGRIVTDLFGNLWIWDYSPPGNPLSRATVFDTTGQMLGTVDTPPFTAVFQIGEDYILTFDRDTLDVEHVRMFRLLK